MSEQFDREEEIIARRKKRLEEMQRSKEKQLRRRKYMKLMLPVAAGVFVIAVLAAAGAKLFTRHEDVQDKQTTPEQGKEYVSIAQLSESVQDENGQSAVSDNAGNMLKQTEALNTTEISDFDVPKEEMPAVAMPRTKTEPVYMAKATGKTLNLNEEIVSSYAVLIDLESDEIVAQKSPKQIINPASMTKVLTVLVAAEHVTDLDDTFTMTIDITDYSYINDCSNAGFLEGEVVTVRDLFYGTVLPSGGDAAVGLATYVAGSQEEFVKLMNEKLEELGLSETAHVTNCVGLFDENHYCTVYDMAMILEAALDNELCREVLSVKKYTTSATEQHPEGILLSNWFLRRIEDKDTGGEVVCGKTGYVVESGNCAASYGVDDSGKGFVCVTADATSSWRCIYDHVALYKQFAT